MWKGSHLLHMWLCMYAKQFVQENFWGWENMFETAYIWIFEDAWWKQELELYQKLNTFQGKYVVFLVFPALRELYLRQMARQIQSCSITSIDIFVHDFRSISHNAKREKNLETSSFLQKIYIFSLIHSKQYLGRLYVLWGINNIPPPSRSPRNVIWIEY